MRPPSVSPSAAAVAPRDARPAGPVDALLEARALACRVEGRTLWAGVDVRLHPGERVGITGPSGSGKTLLLRVLSGLQPAARGVVRFRGRLLEAWFMPEYRARVMYLPQRPLLREGSVEDALRAPLAFEVHQGIRWDAARAARALAAFGREASFLRQRCERLSGGETQIVALLRALALAPEVLLLDEPTASMDRAATAAAEALIADWLRSDAERAALWVSHDEAQLGRTCDRLQPLLPAP